MDCRSKSLHKMVELFKLERFSCHSGISLLSWGVVRIALWLRTGPIMTSITTVSKEWASALIRNRVRRCVEYAMLLKRLSHLTLCHGLPTPFYFDILNAFSMSNHPFSLSVKLCQILIIGRITIDTTARQGLSAHLLRAVLIHVVFDFVEGCD